MGHGFMVTLIFPKFTVLLQVAVPSSTLPGCPSPPLVPVLVSSSELVGIQLNMVPGKGVVQSSVSSLVWFFVQPCRCQFWPRKARQRQNKKLYQFFFFARAWIYVGAKWPHNCNLIFTGEVMLILQTLQGLGASQMFFFRTPLQRT